jgi:Hypothetical glycosyl hydrolase family 15
VALFGVISLRFHSPRQSQSSVAQPTLFNRETYLYSSGLAASAEARRYQFMVLAATDGWRVQLLHAGNPYLKILLYQSVLHTNANDRAYPTATGCTAYLADRTDHPSWFLRDQAGRLVFSRSTTDRYLMDVGDAGYQRACAQDAGALARRLHFDGVFFDAVTGCITCSTDPGIVPTRYQDRAAWVTAMTSLVSYLGPAMRAQHLLAIANISDAPSADMWRQWAGKLDGSEEESWTDGGFGLAQQIPFWPAKLANLVWSEAHGKYELLHSYNATQAGNTYGLAAMLLAANGRASYSTSNANYASYEAWYPEYALAQQLGRARGAYTRRPGGVLQRLFANGLVLVNPMMRASGALRVGPRRYSGSGLRSVVSVALPPTSAVILLADR